MQENKNNETVAEEAPTAEKKTAIHHKITNFAPNQKQN